MARFSTTRRRFLVGGGAVAAAAVGAGGIYVYSEGNAVTAYDEAVRRVRVPFAAPSSMRELVRFASLAANSHNTQAWRFRIGEKGIGILPDFTRRTPAVDPDDHHLFASLGCATENLVVAAAARGLSATAVFDDGSGTAIDIRLEPGRPVETPAFAAIPLRQCSRADYNGKAVPAADLAALAQVASNDRVAAVILTDPVKIAPIIELVLEGNASQYDDPAFVAELKQWIRFNPGEALRHGDGLYTAATGNPSLPGWIGRAIFGFVANAKSEGDKTLRQLRSSAGIAVFVSTKDDRAHWVEAGRAYQRFALEATARGIRHAFVNQAVEVQAVREKLRKLLDVTGRPDLIVRFGYGPAMPKSLRRPVDEILA